MNDYLSDALYLQPEKMLRLYAVGAFPMANEYDAIEWYRPEKRIIIPLDNYNIPRSLKKNITRSNFEFFIDKDFYSVVKNCANREETWINQKLISAYLKLWERGNIHTVEVYQNEKLVGGLYGITFNGSFFGESMFSNVSQASKAALAYLLFHLSEKQFVLLDVQYMTEHLKMFGAIEISIEEYENKLLEAYSMQCVF